MSRERSPVSGRGRRPRGAELVGELFRLLFVGVVDNARNLERSASVTCLVVRKRQGAGGHLEVRKFAPCLALLTHAARTTSMCATWTFLDPRRVSIVVNGHSQVDGRRMQACR